MIKLQSVLNLLYFDFLFGVVVNIRVGNSGVIQPVVIDESLIRELKCDLYRRHHLLIRHT